MNPYFDEERADMLEELADLARAEGDEEAELLALEEMAKMEDSVNAIIKEKNPSFFSKVGESVSDGLNAYGNIALEGMAAINRGAAKTADFFLTTPYNTMAELTSSGNNKLPTIESLIAPATKGSFLEDGVVKDVVQAGGEVIPQSLAIGSALRSAASRLPAVVSPGESTATGSLRTLGSSTAAQDIGYGAASGAGAALGEEVGGAPGAIIGSIAAPAGIAATLSAPAKIRSILTGGDPNVVQRNIDDFASFSEAPTAGMATGSRGLQGTENVSGKAPFGGPLASKAEKLAEKMRNRLINIANDIGPTTGAEDAGLVISKGIMGKGGFLDAFRLKSSALWNKFDTLVDPDQQVFPQKTYDELDSLVRNSSLASLLNNDKLVAMKTILDNPQNISYRDIRDLRSSVGREIANNELTSPIPRAQLKNIYGALSEDIKDIANSVPGGLDAFKRANNFTRSGHQRIDDYLEKIVTKVDPDKIFAAVSKGGEGTKRINAFKRSLKPEEWEVVVSNVVNKLGRSTPGQQNAVGEEAAGDAFSIAKFVTDWEKLGPAKNALFSGSPKINQYREDLNKIARAASTIKESAKTASNDSGTAQQLARYAAGTGIISGAVTQDPRILALTASAMAANNGIARLMTSPKFVSWLAKSQAIPASRSSAAIGSLAGLADQASADEAASIQQLVEELESQ